MNREVVESFGISTVAAQSINSGMFDPGMSLTGEFQHGRLLEYILGSVSHQLTSSDTTHTFGLSSTPPSATIDIGNNLTTDVSNIGSGMMVDSAELSIALNEKLKLTVEFKGKSANISASATTAITSSLITFPHSLCAVGLNDVEASEVQSASITVTKTLERSGGISSNLYQQGHCTKVSFEFKATLGFTNNQFHNLFLQGTASTTSSTISPTSTADPTTYNFYIQADNGVTLGSGRREVKLELTSVMANTFNETCTVGSLTFIEIGGFGRFSSCYSVDNIPSATW